MKKLLVGLFTILFSFQVFAKCVVNRDNSLKFCSKERRKVTIIGKDGTEEWALMKDLEVSLVKNVKLHTGLGGTYFRISIDDIVVDGEDLYYYKI